MVKRIVSDDNKRLFARRLLLYFGGLIVMTFGVAISIKSNLGVSPNTSMALSITLVTGIDIGITALMYAMLMLFFQLLLLRKEFQPVQLLQMPIGVFFGVFLSAFGRLCNMLPDPDTFPAQFVGMLISTVFVALGVFLYVPAELIPLPAEGIVIAITKVTKFEFPTVKVAIDVANVGISLIICLALLRSLGSIGIGTIVSALLVGTEVRFFRKILGEYLNAFLNCNS